MNLPKNKKTQILLIVAGAAVLCALLWFVVIQSRRAMLTSARDRLGKDSRKLEEAQLWLQRGDGIKAEMEAGLKQLEEMEAQMPQANDDFYSKSWEQMRRAQAGHAVEIREVTRPERKEGEKKKDVGLLPGFPYDVSVFSVSGVAHYHDFGRFLADFENDHPYCRVQNVTLGTSLDMGPDAAAGRLAREKLAFRLDIVALIKPNR